MEWLQKILAFFKRLFGLDNPTSAPQDSLNKSRIPQGTQELDLTTDDPPKYVLSKSVFTFQERKFFRILQKAVAGKYYIFPKVRLGDFVYLSNIPQDRKYHKNQIQCKHIDYLLCEKFDCTPILAIELDDSSHKQLDHRTRDEFKSKLLEDIGLPLLRFPVTAEYKVEEVQEKIIWRLQRQSPQNDTND